MSAPKRYTEEVKAEAVRRYMAGESSPKIAADIGCMPCTVMDWVNRSFEHNTKRSDDKMENTTKESPAAAGTATDVSTNINIDRRNDSPYSYDTTEAAFCQAVIREIDESAREIYDNTDDSESSAYYAGKIQGLVYALTLIRGIKS